MSSTSAVTAESVEFLFGEAQARYASFRYKEAIDLYLQAIQQVPQVATAGDESAFPRFAGYVSNCGLCYLKIRQASTGLEMCRRAESIKPNDLRLQLNTAQALFSSHSYDEAKAKLTQISQTAANSPISTHIGADVSKLLEKITVEIAANAQPVVSSTANKSAPQQEVKKIIIDEDKIRAKEQAIVAKKEEELKAATADNYASKATPTSASPTTSPSSSTPASYKVNERPYINGALVPTDPRVQLQSFQDLNTYTIAIYCRNLTTSDVSFDFNASSQLLTVTLKLPATGSTAASTWTASWFLYGCIKYENPSSIPVFVNPYRCELTVTKEVPFSWPTLSRPESTPAMSASGSNPIVPRTNEYKQDINYSAYPTSSKARKDWAAVEEQAKTEEEAEKPQGEDALQKLFQKIYADGDENTRRAMIKSYQTSGGTSLSTNWDEAQKTDYSKESTAPEGMIKKNWNDKDLS